LDDLCALNVSAIGHENSQFKMHSIAARSNVPVDMLARISGPIVPVLTQRTSRQYVNARSDRVERIVASCSAVNSGGTRGDRSTGALMIPILECPWPTSNRCPSS